MKRMLCILALITCVNTYAEQPKKEKWLKDQDDQTDTYAIPLDSSEEEEKQEEKALKNEQKKKQQRQSEVKKN